MLLRRNFIQILNNFVLKIWLILPVVIRSSQRLSHACLSSSTCTVKLRMAHYNSYSLFDIHSTWITVVILELIHAFLREHLLGFTNSGNRSLVSHSKFAYRVAMNHSSFCPISCRWQSIGLPWRSRVTGNQGSIPEREPERRLPHPRKAAGAQITQS